MDIRVVVNWKKRRVVTREYYERAIIPATVAEWENDSDLFEEWLGDNYVPYDVWCMDNNERDSVWRKFIDYCRVEALAELDGEGWEDFLLEI